MASPCDLRAQPLAINGWRAGPTSSTSCGCTGRSSSVRWRGRCDPIPPARRAASVRRLCVACPRARRPRSPQTRTAPFSTRSTATSASAPTSRLPSSVRLISLAGFQVDMAITSSSGIAHVQNLDMTFAMSFMPAFMLPVCRSVEIESGGSPAPSPARPTNSRSCRRRGPHRR